MLDKAIALAAKKFIGVFDKGGKPYILHCLWVMDRVRHLGNDYMIIAVLHDIIEDTDVEKEHLLSMGFSKHVVQAIDCLTKRPGQDYNEYILGIAQNMYAVQVKLRDIEHNSKITRLKYIDDRAVDMIKKYNKAYLFLKDYLR